MKSIFEELGGTYTLGEDGMYYPNLELPVEEEPHYGKYGRMRMNYIKEHRPGLYTELLLNSLHPEMVILLPMILPLVKV